jgi:hypothetical protein
VEPSKFYEIKEPNNERRLCSDAAIVCKSSNENMHCGGSDIGGCCFVPTDQLRGGSSVEGIATATRTPAVPTDETTTSSDQAVVIDNDTKEKDALRAYRMQQHLYLTSRSLQLRQALISRGLVELSHTYSASASANKPSFAVVDWDSALSTKTSPKSCLFLFDAEKGAKVIAPTPTVVTTTNGSNKSSSSSPPPSYQWITVTALNRLRRTDPTKVEPLWHNQYAILSTWFQPGHAYSLSSHLPLFPGQVLTLVLDRPYILTATLTLSLILAVLATWPLWELAARMLLTSRILWRHWSSWYRIVHAAMPLKLLLAQMGLRFVQDKFGALESTIRTYLIEWECRLLQEHLPLTILESSSLSSSSPPAKTMPTAVPRESTVKTETAETVESMQSNEDDEDDNREEDDDQEEEDDSDDDDDA